jgi:hypothetical protein
MIDIYLNQHTNSCKKIFDGGCKNIHYLLVFIKNKYLLVRYYSCENYWGHLDYKQDLINRIIADNKIFPLYKVKREKYCYNDLWRDNKLNLQLKKSAKQVNYIYSDNAGRQYAITTKTNFFDEIFSQNERDIAFMEAEEYLQKMSLDDLLLRELIQLHTANYIDPVKEITIVKTIDNLLKEINLQLKN